MRDRTGWSLLGRGWGPLGREGEGSSDESVTGKGKEQPEELLVLPLQKGH